MLGKMLANRAAAKAAKVAAAEPQGDGLGRTERMGLALRVRDEILWSPTEAVAFVVLIILSFGFLMGRNHYLFVAKLFFPVIVIGVVVVAIQTAHRWRAGDYGLLASIVDLIGVASGKGQHQPDREKQLS